MKSTLKIATLALILCATLMAGCIDSDDAQTSAVPFTMSTIVEDPTGKSDYTYSIHYIVKEDGIGKGLIIGLGDDINIPFSWKAGSSPNEFVIIGIDGNEGILTLSDDGTAIIASDTEDEDMEGTWSRN